QVMRRARIMRHTQNLVGAGLPAIKLYKALGGGWQVL
ncbi:hypothetical protein QF018_004363, partial [Pseudomonas laurylsulfatiphila]